MNVSKETSNYYKNISQSSPFSGINKDRLDEIERIVKLKAKEILLYSSFPKSEILPSQSVTKSEKNRSLFKSDDLDYPEKFMSKDLIFSSGKTSNISRSPNSRKTYDDWLCLYTLEKKIRKEIIRSELSKLKADNIEKVNDEIQNKEIEYDKKGNESSGMEIPKEYRIQN